MIDPFTTSPGCTAPAMATTPKGSGPSWRSSRAMVAKLSSSPATRPTPRIVTLRKSPGGAGGAGVVLTPAA